jgi:hypothetical protein
MFGGVTYGQHYRNGLESGLIPASARPYINKFIILKSQLDSVQAEIESLNMAQKVSLSAVTAIKIAALEKNMEQINFQLLGVTENINREIFAFRDNSVTHNLVAEKENLEAQLGLMKTKLQDLMACKENETNPKKIEILNALLKDSFQKKIPLLRKLILVLEQLDADKFQKQLKKSREVYTGIYDSLGDEAGLPERLTDKSNNINLKETIKRLKAGLEVEVNYLRSISQSQNTRKTTIRHLLQNPEKLIRAMIDERSKDPEHKRRLEEELLAAELKAPRKAKVVKGKKKSNKNKGGGGGAKAPAAVAEAKAAALPKISDKERAIANVYKQGEILEGQVKIHPSMKQWEQPDLTDISTWPKYAELNKTEQREQIIAHTVGIGAERLLNDPALRIEYVWETERGLMMSCLVKLKDGQERYGKLHFVLDEKNRVFHRMFFQAKPEYTMEEFLEERGEVIVPVETDSAAATEEEKIVGRYRFKLHLDQRMEYTLANNAFVESYTIFSFNK